MTSTAPPRNPLPQHTLAEAAKHCAPDDAWAVIDERAASARRAPTSDKRPGVVGAVVSLAGEDCAGVFADYQAARVYATCLSEAAQKGAL